jgi:hypothetical protein
MQIGRFWVMAALLAAQPACADDDGSAPGADGGGGEGDAAPVQADAASAALDPALVGTWTRRDEETGEVEDRYLFDAEGGFHFDEFTGTDSEDHIAGTWNTGGGVLTMIAPDDQDPSIEYHVEISYHAGADRFAWGALLPDGAHDGVLGTWNGSTRIEARTQGHDPELSGSALRLTVREGGGAEVRLTPVGEDARTYDATWSEAEEGGIEIEFTVGQVTIHSTFELIDGAALGDLVYTRQ